MRMVMPTDLWRASSASFFAPGGRSSARLASVTCRMTSATISQWNNCESTPQRYVVLRTGMVASLCG